MIIIDPPSYHFYQNRFFGSVDNCPDGRCEPIKRVATYFEKRGIPINTSDYLLKGELPDKGESIDFYSFGMLNHRKLINNPNIKFRAFVIGEPPMVATRLYKILPELTEIFEKVYVFNTYGDGYSLVGVNQEKLRKFYMPLQFDNVLEPLWNKKERAKRIVIINSIQNPWVFRIVDMANRENSWRFKLNSLKEVFDPRFGAGELYSKRIEAIAELGPLGAIDLYGRNWEKWWSPRTAWLPYWRNRKVLLSNWHGPCASKFEILSNYTFCLAIDNMDISGYVVDKLLDCLYAGTIPLYLGAKDVAEYIPRDVYIDCRNFSSWKEMWEVIKDIPEARIQQMREAGRDFLKSEMGRNFYNSYQEIFGITEPSLIK